MDIDKKLKELRDYANERFIPVLQKSTADILEQWLKKSNPKRILEVGTSIGTSGILMLSRTNAILTTIEIDEDTFLQAWQNFVQTGLKQRCEMINGDCFEVLMLMQKNFDFILLDGPKAHNMELVELVFPMLEKGGTIFIDNIYFHDKVYAEKVEHKHRTIVTNMRKFLQYIQENNEMKVSLYDIGDGIAVIEKL